MSKTINEELEVSYIRAEIASKMGEILNYLEENGNDIWPHEEVNDVTQLLIHLKQMTKSLPINSEYRVR